MDLLTAAAPPRSRTAFPSAAGSRPKAGGRDPPSRGSFKHKEYSKPFRKSRQILLMGRDRPRITAESTPETNRRSRAFRDASWQELKMNDSMGGVGGQRRGPRPRRRWCRTGGDVRCIFGPDVRVLFAIGWVAAGSGASATAQVAAPSCEECAETAFVPLYAPRPIALIAKVTSAVDATEDLWYLRNSLNEGLGVLSWNSHV